MIRVFMDGSSNPTNQSSAIGIILLDGTNQIQIKKRLDEYVDNHAAEFLALLETEKELLARSLEQEFILAYSDSKIVVDSISKRYTKQERYHGLLQSCLELLNKLPNFHLSWIPEKDNKGADTLARQALYSKKQ